MYIYPTRCNVTQFILSGNCSTCFGWYHHPSSGAQTTVSTASGICDTVTATWTSTQAQTVGTGSTLHKLFCFNAKNSAFYHAVHSCVLRDPNNKHLLF